MGTAVTLFKGFVYIIGFGSILFLTYITTRYIGSRANKVAKGKYISTVDTVTIGLNKQLHLIKVGEQFVLISSSGKNIEFLTNVKIDDYEVQSTKSANTGAFDFKSVLDKYFTGFKGKKVTRQSDESERRLDNQYDNSFAGSFKNNLLKLRTITSKVDKSIDGYGDEKADEK